MNSSDDEINLLLPLGFGLFVGCIALILGIVGWILHKTGVINLSKESHLFRVLKAAVFSIVGVFAVLALMGAVVTVIQIIKGFLAR